jgi:hypothetical protein
MKGCKAAQPLEPCKSLKTIGALQEPPGVAKTRPRTDFVLLEQNSGSQLNVADSKIAKH